MIELQSQAGFGRRDYRLPVWSTRPTDLDRKIPRGFQLTPATKVTREAVWGSQEARRGGRGKVVVPLENRNLL